jgi:hypothetical protein
MKDRQKFAEALNTLADIHGRPLTKLAIEAYWIAFADNTDEEVLAAMRKANATAEFMPPPARILKLIPRRKTRLELAQEAEVATWRNR